MQQRGEIPDGDERMRMLIAEGLAQPLQRLAQQRLSGGKVALVLGLESGLELGLRLGLGLGLGSGSRSHGQG